MGRRGPMGSPGAPGLPGLDGEKGSRVSSEIDEKISIYELSNGFIKRTQLNCTTCLIMTRTLKRTQTIKRGWNFQGYIKTHLTSSYPSWVLLVYSVTVASVYRICSFKLDYS